VLSTGHLPRLIDNDGGYVLLLLLLLLLLCQALDQARQQLEQLKQQQQQQDGVAVSAEELARQVKMNGRLRAEVTRKEAALKVCLESRQCTMIW